MDTEGPKKGTADSGRGQVDRKLRRARQTGRLELCGGRRRARGGGGGNSPGEGRAEGSSGSGAGKGRQWRGRQPKR